tara:strand:- start:344 stop:670 length:327 start_codon:yes stop_codon:yes gene_type:complete
VFEIITTILAVLLSITLLCLIISVRINMRMGKIVLKVEDAIEDSLDILDTQYNKISMILEKPVFFDSPEVRQTIEDIGQCRDSILFVASVMSDSITETPDEIMQNFEE